uniref:Uncharacterized protein n=1 Tax=Panagrolaimus sp. PS1159 TaxID=55785 RepID=A0AC35FY74_9BILA
MKICKFFKHRNFPYFVVNKIENNGDRWEYWSLDGEKHSLGINEDLPNNLWIVKEIRLYREFNFTALFEKIVVCDAKYLIFHDCSPTISYNQFKYLTASGNVEDLLLCGSVVRYEENGEAVPFEAILECLPKIIAITL